MGLGFTDYTEIEVTIVSTTDRALRVEHEGDVQWIPRQWIETGNDDFGEGECVEISVADWKLSELGWDG